MQPEKGDPSVTVTQDDIARSLRQVGVVAGDTVMFHSSRSSMGTVIGGPDTVEVYERMLAERGLVRYGKIGSATLRCTRARRMVENWVAAIEAQPERWLPQNSLDWLARAQRTSERRDALGSALTSVSATPVRSAVGGETWLRGERREIRHGYLGLLRCQVGPRAHRV